MANSVPKIDWREHGVEIIRFDQLDSNTSQTLGMNRAAAITHARTGANKLWAGTVTIHANAKTVAHHHESVIYVVSGRARMGWGEHLSMWPTQVRAILYLCHTRRSTPGARGTA